MSNQPKPEEVLLTTARLSFPVLWVPKSFQGGEPQYSAAFLLDSAQDAEQIMACRKAMTVVAQQKWGAQMPKLTPDRLALRNGNTKPEVDGYGEGVMFVSANNRSPFPIVDLDPRVVLNRETGAKVYAGCYVNAKIRFWAQDNQFGKRINAQVLAIQYVAEGEAFGEAPVKADEVFDNLAGEGGASNPFEQSTAPGEESGGLLG